MIKTNKFIASVLALVILQFLSVMQASAQEYRGYVNHVRESYGCYTRQHPMAKKVIKDAAIGTAAGALVGLATHRGVIHGALIGAGTGAGIGVLRGSELRYTHPVASGVGSVALAGLGLYLASSHRHGL